MKNQIITFAFASLILAAAAVAQAAAPDGFTAPIGAADPALADAPALVSPKEAKLRAMLEEICAAADRIAERYDNPPYCHIVTNDPAKAEALRDRVEAMGTIRKLRRELEKAQDQLQATELQVAAAAEREAMLRATIRRQEDAMKMALAAIEGLKAPELAPAPAKGPSQ